MNYLLKSKPKNENRKKIAFIFSLYFFLSLFGFLFGNAWRKAMWVAARPIWSAVSIVTAPFGSIGGYFTAKSNLVQQNALLLEKVATLENKQLDYDIVLQENEALKKELGREGEGEKIIAAILSKPPKSPYDTLVVDAGSEDGIIPGSKVFLGENVIIGLITNITPHTSLVSLFSTGGQKQEAVHARTGSSYALDGKGGGNFQLEIPKDTDIVWGDIFVYPGISQSILAIVDYIDSNSQSSFKMVYLKVPANFFSAKSVYVQKAE